MKLRRVMLAAPGSGSGKTTLTCALLQLFKDMGEQVAACKCGPDYIDPMFHKTVLELTSKNLDTYFLDDEKVREALLSDQTENGLVLIEGVMGLYDGIGMTEKGSSYNLASVTETPIILVIDTKGMGRSVVALIAGFLQYDSKKLIKGVILNRTSPMLYETFKATIEAELGLIVVGFVPDMKEITVKSRYLGLCLPHELEGIREQIKAISNKLKETLDIEKLFKIAGESRELPVVIEDDNIFKANEASPIIAVALDEAFCFYYEDNLSALKRAGARLEYFSPIHDHSLPSKCSALLLGGGYPELYADKLSANLSMREQIRISLANGMPVVAECGGYMYLHNNLIDKDNNSYPLVGAIPANCYYTGKLVRFGYIELREKCESFLKEGTSIKGHEFHYFDSEANGQDCIARKPSTGREYDCLIDNATQFVGFPHIYYPSNMSFVENFVQKSRNYALSLRL